MTKTEIANLKSLISTFCRNEINHNHCHADDCEFCPMNSAYEKVQDSESSDEEE